MEAKEPKAEESQTKFGKSGRSYLAEALTRSHSETQYVASLAEKLFQSWWTENESDPNMGRAPAVMEKCFRAAEAFRKYIDLYKFELLEEYDKDLRAKMPVGADGKSKIILPDAGQVEQFFPKGHFPGISEHHHG